MTMTGNGDNFPAAPDHDVHQPRRSGLLVAPAPEGLHARDAAQRTRQVCDFLQAFAPTSSALGVSLSCKEF